jgi:chromosome segregation ATPase
MSSYTFIYTTGLLLNEAVVSKTGARGGGQDKLHHKETLSSATKAKECAQCVQRRKDIRNARKRIAELSEEVQSTKKAKTKLLQDLDEALQEIKELKGPV